MVGLPPERMVWRASLAFLNQRAAGAMRQVFKERELSANVCRLQRFRLPAPNSGLFASALRAASSAKLRKQNCGRLRTACEVAGSV